MSTNPTSVAAAAAAAAFAASFVAQSNIAASSSVALGAAAAAVDDEENERPWDDPDWIPRGGTGKQKSPNAIRGELQRYIDASSETQTSIIQRMGVNNNSFRRFMNPKTYKDQWSAVQNNTYWAAARLLAQDKYDREQAKKAEKKAGRKRKVAPVDGAAAAAAASASASSSSKKSKKDEKVEAVALMNKINAVENVDTTRVYDSCPEVVKKIKAFVARPGVTKSDFCDALGGINSNSLNRFLLGKKQDQCANQTYQRAYAFFERQRVMEGQSKTARRLKNEAENPGGFSLEKARQGTWKFLPGIGMF